jgi:uncharacterized radical SAM superfamily Fe-S cluster-containing enzyme
MNKHEFLARMEEELATWRMIDRWFDNKATVDIIRTMAKTYSKALYGVISHNLLDQTFLIAQRENKAVPTIKDFIEADKMAKMNPEKQDHLQLPEFVDREYTPEELAQNKKRLGILAKVACGKISPAEGEKLQEELLEQKQ